MGVQDWRWSQAGSECQGKNGERPPGRPAEPEGTALPCGLGAGSGHWLWRRKMQLDALVDRLTKISNSSRVPSPELLDRDPKGA